MSWAAGNSGLQSGDSNAPWNCTIQPKADESGKVGLQWADETQHFARLRFPGDVPDRFFARTGDIPNGAEYTQFASRKNEVTNLKLQTLKRSRLHVEYLEGGSRITWIEGQKHYSLKCSFPKSPGPLID